MERAVFFIFFGLAVQGDIGQHFYIPTSMTWSEAQAYCRQHYTDLSSVRSQSDGDKLLKVSGQWGWIGLQHDLNKTVWKWSGGGNVTYQNWAAGEPNNWIGRENNGIIISDGRWLDVSGTNSHPFYCVNGTVVELKKSWEEALEHCREHEADLPSLLSEPQLLLAQREIQHRHITEPVWIGLRYLGDRWLWVNGDPLVYKAWPQGGDQDHQCPAWRRCGALTKDRGWENWDCRDKLHFICV